MGYRISSEENYGQKERPYEKPTIVKQAEMNFPLEIIASATGEKVLHLDKQCSSCHSCR